MYDIAIIGAGPAGLSAAITARARNKNVVVISNKPQDSPLAKSHLVDNYPGLPSVSGLALLNHLYKHAHDAGSHTVLARVISILPFGDSFMITTSGDRSDGDANSGKANAAGDVTSASQNTGDAGGTAFPSTSDLIEAKSVILATGATSNASTIAGEQEYLGRGVSYCATCDGMLYRQATVVVAGLSPEAPDEANFLAEIGATVHYITPKLTQQLIAVLKSGIIIHEGKITAIDGDASGVQQVHFSENLQGDAKAPAIENTLAARGVFVLRPQIAPTTLLPTLKLRDGYIDVDTTMRTSVAGVFAAGDCVGKPLQVAKAVGEGQVATFSAVEYLTEAENHQAQK